MSLLDRARPRRPGRAPDEGGDDRPGRDPLSWELLLPGARTALASWLLLALPALLAWVLAPLSSVTWLQALGVASAGWYLGHGLPVSVGATTVGLVPLGITAVLLVMTGRSVSRLLDDTEAVARGTTWPRLLGRRILPGYALGYLAVALLAWLTTSGSRSVAGTVSSDGRTAPASVVSHARSATAR
jgi:Family of unknown function (DUF6350)